MQFLKVSSRLPPSVKTLGIGSSETPWLWLVTPGPSLTGAWPGEMGSPCTRWKLPSSGHTMAKPTCSVTASSGGLTRAKRGNGWTFSQNQATPGITACGQECRRTWMTSSAGEKVTFRCTSVSWFFSDVRAGFCAISVTSTNCSFGF